MLILIRKGEVSNFEAEKNALKFLTQRPSYDSNEDLRPVAVESFCAGYQYCEKELYNLNIEALKLEAELAMCRAFIAELGKEEMFERFKKGGAR